MTFSHLHLSRGNFVLLLLLLIAASFFLTSPQLPSSSVRDSLQSVVEHTSLTPTIPIDITQFPIGLPLLPLKALKKWSRAGEVNVTSPLLRRELESELWEALLSEAMELRPRRRGNDHNASSPARSAKFNAGSWANETIFSIKSSVYRKPWLGRALVHSRLGSARKPICLVTLLLRRPFLRAEMRHGDENPSRPLSFDAAWSDVMRHDAGPDSFDAYLLGAEVAPFSVQRRWTSPCRNTANESRNAFGICDGKKRRGDDNNRFVTYALTATIEAAGSYAVMVDHLFYNNGAFHDRDRLLDPYMPKLVLSNSRGSMVRANAVKLPVVSLRKLTRKGRSSMFVVKCGDKAEKVKVDDASQAHRRQPWCSLNFVTASRNSSVRVETSFLLRGKYKVVTRQADRLAPVALQRRGFKVKGWDWRKRLLGKQQFAWRGSECELFPYAGRLQSSVVMVAGQRQFVAKNLTGELAQCFLDKNKKILLLGDSQVRSVFNTLISTLTGEAAAVNKISYGFRFLKFERFPNEHHQSLAEEIPIYNSDALQDMLTARKDSANRRQGTTMGATESFVEFLWDPVGLNLSSFVSGGRRLRYMHFKAQQARRVSLQRRREVELPRDDDDINDGSAEDEMLSHSENSNDSANAFGSQADSGAGRLNNASEESSAGEGSDAFAVDAPADPKEVAHRTKSLEEYAIFGPNASGVARGFDLLRSSVTERIPDVIIFGFGGWFGLQFWTMDEVDAHLEDIVAALRAIVQIRRTQARNKLTLIFLGSPAWPTFVAWPAFRRNTNYRLGAITQRARQVFETLGEDLNIISLPYFEMSQPMKLYRYQAKDIHYDRSMIPYQIVELIGTLLCQS